MRRLPKGKAIFLFMLVSAVIATPVLAWVVYSNGIFGVSLIVKRAEASWEEVEIEIPPVNSGANFSATAETVLTIANAETLYMSFETYTLTEEEIAALESLTVTIGEDTNEDGEMDVMWGIIEVLPLPLPWPSPFALAEGVYNVVILVEGVAGYPEVETPIDFVVGGTCEAIPITLP